MVRTPGYRLHRPSGRAVVTLNGKDHYLGVHGSAESKAAYKRLAEYKSSGKLLCYGVETNQSTVAMLICDYKDWAQGNNVRFGLANSRLSGLGLFQFIEQNRNRLCVIEDAEGILRENVLGRSSRNRGG